MLKKIILTLCILISFIAGALFFAWKPLLINSLNNSLALENSGVEIVIIAINKLELKSDKLSIESLQFTVNGHLQSLKNIDIVGQLSQGQIQHINIQDLLLDTPELLSSPETQLPPSDQPTTLSAATISAQIQDLLSFLENDFSLHIANISIRQLTLPTTRFELNIANKNIDLISTIPQQIFHLRYFRL